MPRGVGPLDKIGDIICKSPLYPRWAYTRRPSRPTRLCWATGRWSGPPGTTSTRTSTTASPGHMEHWVRNADLHCRIKSPTLNLIRFPGGTGAEDNPCEAVRPHAVHSGARQGEVLRHDEGAQRGQRQGRIFFTASQVMTCSRMVLHRYPHLLPD